MENSHIYIIGSGAIGKALAVFLQQENRPVSLVRGSVDHQPAIRNMITVTDQNRQEFRQKIDITTFSRLPVINGIVLIAAKAFANAELAEKLRKKKGKFSVVLLQNGLNIELPFAGFDNVYRCVLFSSSQILGKNEVSFKMVTDSPVGIVRGSQASLTSIIRAIHTPFFGFRSESDIKKYVWDKVILNCVYNSICPLLETDSGIFYKNNAAAKLANIVISECVALANEFGIYPDQQLLEKNLLLISEQINGQHVSTFEDIRKNRRTEIRSLNLEIARLADEIGKPELVGSTRLLGEMILIKSLIGSN